MGKNVFSDNALKQFIQLLISEGIIVQKLRESHEIGSTPYLISGNKEDDITKDVLLIFKYILKR